MYSAWVLRQANRAAASLAVVTPAAGAGGGGGPTGPRGPPADGDDLGDLDALDPGARPRDRARGRAKTAPPKRQRERKKFQRRTTLTLSVQSFMKSAAVHAVHSSVKSAKKGLVFTSSESFRIFLNFCKLVHLYGSLPVVIPQSSFSRLDALHFSQLRPGFSHFRARGLCDFGRTGAFACTGPRRCKT